MNVQPDTRTGVMLYLEDVSVSFDGFQALDHLSLTVDVGELRCLIGPNGAGKSTLMDGITGKTEPDAGQAGVGQNIELLQHVEAEFAGLGCGRNYQ